MLFIARNIFRNSFNLVDFKVTLRHVTFHLKKMKSKSKNTKSGPDLYNKYGGCNVHAKDCKMIRQQTV